MTRRSVGIVAGALLLGGCASALREPRPIEDLAGIPVGPRSAEAVIEAAREKIRLAERSEDASARRDAAERAVEAMQWCGRIDPGRPECSYWLGVALGLQARERPATAAAALPRMIDAFSRAAREAPGIDHAGPDRALALLYVRAPGWPLGPGDPDRGLEHASRAVAIDGRFAPNRLALAEALAATGDDAGAANARGEALAVALEAEAAGEADAAERVREVRKALDLR